MRICEIGCEFMIAGYCQLHEQELKYANIENGKIMFIRCRNCKIEKEQLDMIQDLDKMEEFLNAYKGIYAVAANERPRPPLEIARG